jgi:MFS family permease
MTSIAARPPLTLTEPMRRVLGLAGLAGLVVFGAAIAVGGAGGRTFVNPASAKGTPGWITGPFSAFGVTITAGQFFLALVAMCLCYGAVLVAGDALSWRWVFYVNVPVGVAALAVLLLAFPDVRPAVTRRPRDRGVWRERIVDGLCGTQPVHPVLTRPP